MPERRRTADPTGLGEFLRARRARLAPAASAYEVLQPANADGQRLVVYQAQPGTADHDAMLLLALSADPLPNPESQRYPG